MSAETESRPRRGVRGATALFAATFVVCLACGILWVLAANDSGVAYAAERDEVLREGQGAIINFNTLDYRDVQRGLDRWESNATGPLLDEVRQGRKSYADQLGQAKSSTTAKVLDAGLVELNDREGKARMIAVVQVTVNIDGQPPSVKPTRYQADLTRVGDTWKLSGLGAVPVG
ncbi:nuclear transport factor 2 family protein [Saccharopolyspora rosea]|uniref:Nuclear transport factor 2 family protein n=1 Tax=Saccharopolyspora rosea TaxID=524884 RepID=A0ABW3FJ47_9PSEU|nr:nuclear transport factor 2 family protein [Saccharopolyspora rosea]